MKPFKLTIEYSGDNLDIKTEDRYAINVAGVESLDDIIRHVRKAVSVCMVGGNDSYADIGEDLKHVGIDPSLLIERVFTIDEVPWHIYEVLRVLKTNDYDTLRNIADKLLSLGGQQAEIVMAMSALYNQSHLALLIMSRCILPYVSEAEKARKLHSTYLALSISDNIDMLNNLELEQIPPVAPDAYIAVAAENNSYNVARALLYNDTKPSANGISVAIKIASKYNHTKIVKLLNSYATTIV